MYEDKHIVGFVEEVSLLDENNEAIKGFESIKARIDSGATIGSIDKSFVEKIKPKEVGKKLVKSSHGITRRVVVELTMSLAGNIVSGNFTVIDRSHMTYPILVGQDVLLKDYIIDPKKNKKE